MSDRLIELIKQAKKHTKNANSDIERNMIFADYLLANGVVCPPCKVGQTVYLLQKYYGTYCFNVVEDKVQMIGITSRGIHIKARNHHDHNKMYMLGKTVFLTREEAEAKLKEGVQG